MKTVIVTGGIGSGKSAVCACLAARGVPVYDSDSRTKSLYDRHPELVERLECLFSVPLRDPAGRLDRKALSAIIFSDPGKKLQLEALVHPVVKDDFLRWKRWHRPKGWTFGPVPFVVLESALILSSPCFGGIGDKVVLVDADESVRIARAAARDGVSPQEILRRARLQTFDRTRVDAVLMNNGSPEALSREVNRIFLNLFTIFAD